MLRRLRKWVPFGLLGKSRAVVTVLPLNGVIGPAARFGQGLNLSGLAGAIESAFTESGVKAVALSINSPGGSPVQATLIHNRIRQFAEEKNLPVFAFAEDVAASGGYMLACAGDQIFADDSSVVGSIGVISAGFGFTGLMEKIGVDRRVFTAGDRKSMLDPFQEVDEEDVKRLLALQKEVHGAFRDLVKTRREGKLNATEKRLFSGEFWSGIQAEKLGLIDGIGDLRTEMRKRYGDDVRLKVISADRSWFRGRLTGEVSASAGGGIGGFRLPVNWADDMLSALEVRAIWSRFGL